MGNNNFCITSPPIHITLADLGEGHREHVNPPLILNSVLMVSLPSVILYKRLLNNSHCLVVVNPPFDFSRSASALHEGLGNPCP